MASLAAIPPCSYGSSQRMLRLLQRRAQRQRRSTASSIFPTKLNFGTVSVGRSKIKMVKVTNAGKIKKNSQPLPILVEGEIETGVPTPSPFSVTTQCTDDNLQPGGKGVPKSETFCEIAVQFEPIQAASYKGTLTILDNLKPNEKQAVQLKGKGKVAK
jgi:hypothetical protein